VNSLKELLDDVPDNIDFNALGSTTVANIVQTVVDLWSLYFRQCQDKWTSVAAVLQELSQTASIEAAYSDPLIRQQELSRPFYKLVPDRVNEFRMNINYQVQV